MVSIYSGIMSYKASLFGFWIPIKDDDSAYYAAKMSGLPVFLLGLSLYVMAFAFVTIENPILFSLSLLLALFLKYSGLRIHGGNFRTLPVSVGVWLIYAVLASYYAGFHTSPYITVYSASTLLSFLIALLAISGLRGWWYLKKRETEPADN